jgi:hypothetical protein
MNTLSYQRDLSGGQIFAGSTRELINELRDRYGSGAEVAIMPGSVMTAR